MGMVPPPPPTLTPPVTGLRLRAMGPDWVAVARWITLGYGILSALALIVVGLLVQHINVPIADPATGLTTVQTFNIGPAFAVAAVLVCVFAAVFAWLTRYAVARVIFLVLDLLAIVTSVSQIGVQNRVAGAGAVGLFSLALDLAYAGVLLMSLRPRPQPAFT